MGIGDEIAKHTFDQARKQPPMPHRRSPVVAFFVAFFFGFLGYGIYTGDWKAAGWLFLTIIILSIVIPGLGLLVGLAISGGMCAHRVSESNAAGGH